eukprot:TRINITY_DN3306_c0_g1_i2.p1 TRINITY_DN3306_c0_g1~~TRINITY_DN3306_c0_g1_i2.p1  ORF type:complete len:1210 (+),score=214.82 TRINITY_DN3306_c0_g1_i2:422-4051(+)
MNDKDVHRLYPDVHFVPAFFYGSTYLGGYKEIKQMIDDGAFANTAEILSARSHSLKRHEIESEYSYFDNVLSIIQFDMELYFIFDTFYNAVFHHRMENLCISDGIKWIQDNISCSRSKCEDIIEQMVHFGYLRLKSNSRNVGDLSEHFEFSWIDKTSLNTMSILKSIQLYNSNESILIDVYRDLLHLMNEYLDIWTGYINYKDLIANTAFIKFFSCISIFQMIKFSSFNNKIVPLYYLYKILLIHVNILRYKHPNQTDIFNTYSYRIGDTNYTLNIISLILRGKLSEKILLDLDPGLRGYQFDPRIYFLTMTNQHFSPPILLITEKTADLALHQSVQLYAKYITISPVENTVIMPYCFKLFKEDVVMTKNQFLCWISGFLPPPKEKILNDLISSRNTIHIQFSLFEWEVGNNINLFEISEYSNLVNNVSTFSDHPIHIEHGPFVDGSQNIYLKKSTIDMTSNLLTGIPSGILSVPLKGVKTLILDDNEISEFPQEFAIKLESLCSLSISLNSLDNIPYWIRSINSLQSLNLSQNNIRYIPRYITCLPNLQSLSIGYNYLSFIPLHLSLATNLTSLDLSGNSITDIPYNLAELSLLTDLHLDKNAISIFPKMKTLKRLEEFTISNNQIKDIDFISGFRHLKKFDASHNLIKEIPKKIHVLESLTELILYHNKIKSVPHSICSLSLELIDLEDNPLVTPPLHMCRGMEDIRLYFDWKPRVRRRTRKKNNQKREFLTSAGHSDITSFINRDFICDLTEEDTSISEAQDVNTDMILHSSGYHIAKNYNMEEQDFLEEYSFKSIFSKTHENSTYKHFFARSDTNTYILRVVCKSEVDNVKRKSSNSRYRKKTRSGNEKMFMEVEDDLQVTRDIAIRGSLRSSIVIDKESKKSILPLDKKKRKSKSNSEKKRQSLRVGKSIKSRGKERKHSLPVPETYVCLIRSYDRDRTFHLKMYKLSVKNILKSIKEQYPEYGHLHFKLISDPELNRALLNLDMKLTVTGYKVGVLYAKSNQTEEQQFYGNRDPSVHFIEFLNWLGREITLSEWRGYNGGLDTKKNLTGEKSIYTNFKGYDIMFHVSTMLPFDDHDEEQIERKRHLGNDIVVIIFQEGDTPFDPSVMKSFYNHVYIIVRKDMKSWEQNKTTSYRISSTSKYGVLDFGSFSENELHRKNNQLRNTFLSKVINAERASYESNDISSMIVRARKQGVDEIYERYIV